MRLRSIILWVFALWLALTPLLLVGRSSKDENRKASLTPASVASTEVDRRKKGQPRQGAVDNLIGFQVPEAAPEEMLLTYADVTLVFVTGVLVMVTMTSLALGRRSVSRSRPGGR